MGTNPGSIYKPLRSDLKEIRLLDISTSSAQRVPPAAQTGGQIQCRLEHASIDAQPCPHFVALSYVWGDASRTTDISLSGRPFGVTHNLKDFMRALVSAAPNDGLAMFRGSLFWIDAVCINQAGGTEKEQQVQMMRQIYQSASKTVIWLGEEEDDSPLVFDWLELLSEIDLATLERWTSAEKDDFWDERNWNAFCKLFAQRAWFRRRWIVQEAVVSKDLWIVCGRKALSWESFYAGVERCGGVLFNDRLARLGVPKTLTDVDPLMNIGILRYRISQGGFRTSMFELLTRFRRNATTDLRDRVYALLGLCSQNEVARNPVGYDETTTVETVFIRLALNHIRIFADLNILNACTEESRVARRAVSYQASSGIWVHPDNPTWARVTALPTLPTWAPNWTSPRAEWVLGPESLGVSDAFGPLFLASADYRAQVLNMEDAAETKILEVQGVELDRVRWTHNLSPVPDPDQSNPFSNIFLSFWDFCSATSYANRMDLFDAFLRTLSGGGRREGINHFFSTRYLRFRCLQFFQNAPLGRKFAALGFREDRPPREEYYENPAAAERFSDDPRISFNKLCFFKLFISEKGRVGLAPPHTAVGDKVCVLFGGSSPLLLHESPQKPGHLCIRGEVYMHGYMFGEAIRMLLKGELVTQKFLLV